MNGQAGSTVAADRLQSRLFILIGLIEAGALCILLAIYKSPSFIPDWTATTGILFLLGVAAFGAASLLLGCSVWRFRPESRGALGIAVGANLLVLILCLASLELLLRVIAAPGATGVRIGAIEIPSTWDHIRQENLELMRAATPSGAWTEPYLVPDGDLGWTNGADRTSRDGLYASSIEGIRSAVAGVTFADRQPEYRVAIVGDSNAFSLEVPFAESWGHYLEAVLGPDTQVLNFGVDGYGIDQALLRYERDVVPWQPDIVLLGFIQDDFWRSTFVYPLIDRGWKIPFTKPRFLLKPRDAAGLDVQRLPAVVNMPLISPNQILSTRNVLDLPFVEVAQGYEPLQWYIRRDSVPLLIRYLHALVRRWPVPNEHNSETATLELNTRLLERFADSVGRNGSIPLFVYFPGDDDFGGQEEPSLAARVLQRFGQPVLNLTSCLREVPPEIRRVPSGNHYTGVANLRAAACVEPLVRQALQAGKSPNS